MICRHITLLTGHESVHRLDTLDAAAVEACAALLPTGGPVPAFPAFRAEIVEGWLCTVWRARDPVVTFGVGRGAGSAWDVLVDLQERIAAAERRPAPAGAWIAVVLLPGIVMASREDIGWLGDFERCMAAAMFAAGA